MARLTITEAIKASPIKRTRMYSHYIKKGLITVSVDSSGEKYIDSSELLRVFGTIKKPDQPVTPTAHSEHPLETFRVNATELEKPATTVPPEQETELVKLLREQLQKAEDREQQHLKRIDSLTLRLEAPKPLPKRQNVVVKWWNNLGGKDESA
jgi:hypothetical protein